MFLIRHVILEDHLIKGLCGWEPVIVSHHFAKFGGHRHCGSGDMLLVVEELDSKCLLTSAITIFFKASGLSCFHTRNFR